MELVVKHTKEMSNIELVKVFQTRINVFIVEQNCTYQEVDEFDLNTLHVMLKNGEEIVAYSRIIEHPSYITFGRVLVVEKYRKSNYGRKIVKATLNKIKESYKQTQVRISGQAYLKAFYESFGFESVSDVYLEDNIPHITFQMYLDR
ncbi:GNAT family N-acetyltransferase [Staphylococcus pseudoxylosus]|uniref:GNAT family N-acetyltransferase n=2 Tax=Staphylococcus pseudoxylosus TaxID=2282419 RepID=A0AAQ0MK64_9STAP|nr:GNAT family N-acetyltransferase [Staphylococcus pseudoxylosus]PTI80569.1 GNAT family N-acetyltransferase [Staphylococcus xylosus]MCE5001561.1 GNAT family N-acetyltransferase [Staphylococcus pseudoxylosus]MDW8546173.1 GNAT family N-acetyltransferase [Staphylococcus pseudoxylosus]MEB5782961.1 GNAT family N-acetyltransferase [Staphylococcus pseudoxylosus]MEB6332317.1 GNAT family N-acetyltransferase [Staphylococcus pseudoxylosus]